MVFTRAQAAGQSGAFAMAYSGAGVRMYPDLTAASGATTTGDSGSLHVSGTAGSAGAKANPAYLFGFTVAAAPATLATLIFSDHAGVSIPGRAYGIPTAGLGLQIWFGDEDGAAEVQNGFSVVSNVACTIAIDWRPRS